MAALMISTAAWAQDATGDDGSVPSTTEPTVTEGGDDPGIAVGEPSPDDADPGEVVIEDPLPDEDDTGDGDWADDGGDGGSEDAGDGDSGGDDILVGVCGWADGTEPSGPCNGEGDGIVVEDGDGLVGICGWAAGAEPSGPCNTFGEVDFGDGQILYMTGGPLDSAHGGGSDQAANLGGGGPIVTRFQPRGTVAISSFGATNLAQCLADYPDLPWICEWQYGADQ
jgi:hypothetical protein